MLMASGITNYSEAAVVADDDDDDDDDCVE
jgi:hypothetical protein